ncbi:MAG: putative transport system ATP-binding protein, partial [Blastocatellia bacterium]|nr:putative transport system ATP-binding protein [Blastocatellia bacterium]
MTEATVTTSETSSGLIGNSELPANGKAETLIAMRDLWKTYDMGAEKVHALHGVSFEVKRGDYLAITGPSGSG